MIVLKILLLATALTVTTAPAAQAQEGDVACTGSITAGYSPGLKLTARQTTVTAQADFPTCTSTSNVSEAKLTMSATGRLSCTAGELTGTATMRWDHNRESKIRFTGEVAVQPNGESVLALSGTVVKGAFAGSSFASSPVLIYDLTPICQRQRGAIGASGPVQFSLS